MMDQIYSLFPLIKLGGWMMWPIVACSLLALAIILERTWVLIVRPGRIIPRAFVDEVEALLVKGEVEAAIVACRKDDSMVARVLLAGLNQYGRAREIIREALEDAGRGESYELDRFLNMLSSIAVVSPLLGLLGTVVGMIRVFMDLSSQHLGQYEGLASGIYVALLTTAAGLIVAIPSYLAHRTFLGLADRKVREMEDLSIALLNRLDRAVPRKPAPIPASPATDKEPRPEP